MVDRSVSIGLDAKVSGFVAGMRTAKAAAGGLVSDLEKSAKAATSLSQRHKQAITSVANGFGVMGAAAAAGLAIAVKTAADFDAKMSEVQAATQDGAKGMAQLRAAAIKAGADTVFSAGEAADGITNLAKAGISTADILNGGLKGALSLASAGQIDVASAAEDTATALTQFGLKGSSASHVADLLAASANKAQGEVGDMAIALNYAGIPAAQLGVSINQAVGTIALFAKSGLIGSQAGTTLRGVLSSLTSPSKVAASTMADLGIKVFDAQGKFIGLDGVAQQLHDHMGNLTQAERSYALGRIFGNQQLQGANILYKSGAAGVDEWTNKVNDSGYAAKVAATKMNNLKGDLENLKGSLQTALIGTGEGAQTPLRGLTQNLTQLVNKYNDLGPAAQSNISKVLGAAALLGGSAFVTGKTVVGINNTVQALKDMKVTARGLGTSFAAVGAGLLVIKANADMIQQMKLALGASPTLTSSGLPAILGSMQKSGFADYAKQSGINTGMLAKEIEHVGGSGAYTKQILDQLTQATGGTNEGFAQLGGWKASIDRMTSVLPVIGKDLQTGGLAAYDARTQLHNLIATVEAYRKAQHHMHTQEIQDVLASNAMFGMYRHQLEKLPRQVLTKVVTPGALDSTKKVEDLARKYYLTPRQIRTIMRALDYATPAIHKVMRDLKALSGTDSTAKIHADAKQAHDQYRQTKSELIELGHIRPQPVITSNTAPFENGYRNVWGELSKLNNAHAQANLDANPIPALQALARTQQAINSLHGTTVTNYVNTVHHGGAQPGFAGGGYTGLGGKYDVAGVVHRREFVSDSETTARARPLLEALHRSKGRMFGFSEGGGADRRQMTWSGGTSGGAVRLAGPVEIRGKVDLDTGRLIGTMHAIADQAVDDAADFNRTMRGRR